jgi:hypothetical protein
VTNAPPVTEVPDKVTMVLVIAGAITIYPNKLCLTWPAIAVALIMMSKPTMLPA